MLPGSSVGRFSNSEQWPHFNQCGSLLIKAGCSEGYDWTLHVLDKYCLTSGLRTWEASCSPSLFPQSIPWGHFSCSKWAWLRLFTPEAWFRPLEKNLPCSPLSHSVPPCPTRLANLEESFWLAGFFLVVVEGFDNVVIRPLVMALSGLLFCMYGTHLQILS